MKLVLRPLLVLPALVEAILVLPAMARQLEDVRESTATLPEMLEEIRLLRASIAEVERNTAAVQHLAEVALPLQGAALRVGRFADRLPRRSAAP